MGEAGESRMTTHQQKKLDVDALLRVPRPLRAAAVATTTSRRSRFYQARRRQRRDALPARAPRGARRLPAARGGATAPPLPVPAARALRAVRARTPTARRCRTTMAVGAHARQPAEGRDARARASCRSSPTRRARSAWPTCSGRSASTRRSASSTSPRTRARCSTTARRTTARSSRKASPRPARCASWTAAATVVQRARPARCCRSTSTTRCSASSASAT